MMAFANVVVYNYQYMIDPKVSQMVGVVVCLNEEHNLAMNLVFAFERCSCTHFYQSCALCWCKKH